MPAVGYPPPSLFRVHFLKACVFCAMLVELAPAAAFCRPAAFRRSPRRPRHPRDRLQPMPFFLRVGNFLPTSLPLFLRLFVFCYASQSRNNADLGYRAPASIFVCRRRLSPSVGKLITAPSPNYCLLFCNLFVSLGSQGWSSAACRSYMPPPPLAPASDSCPLR